MARRGILKLSGRSHLAQRTRAGQNLLVNGIILERIRRNVIHAFPPRQHLVAQALHVVELIVQQLKALSIVIG